MNRGDVVLVDWPFSDLSGSKLRPAIVVQADFLNGLPAHMWRSTASQS
jgi:mRNA-degrading endonuclease toxin of MazEF toxin-antitoxin module